MSRQVMAPLPPTQPEDKSLTYLLIRRLVAAIILLVLIGATLGMTLLVDAQQPGQQRENLSHHCPDFTAAGDGTESIQTWETTMPDYNLELGIGPPQSMWTRAQITQMAQHGCTLWGEATDDQAISGDAQPVDGDYEMRLIITDRTTGQVLARIEPLLHILIFFHNNAVAQSVHLMGLYDPVNRDTVFHYGANVHLDREHIDRVVVTIGGESSTFSL